MWAPSSVLRWIGVLTIKDFTKRVKRKVMAEGLNDRLGSEAKCYFCSKRGYMYILLVSIIIGLFIAMLFLNLYFRFRVLRTYRKLVQNRVEFGAKHLFNPGKMEEEIYPRYPHMREEISIFSRHMRYSIRMATVLILLITLFGAVLMYYREG